MDSPIETTRKTGEGLRVVYTAPGMFQGCPTRGGAPSPRAGVRQSGLLPPHCWQDSSRSERNTEPLGSCPASPHPSDWPGLSAVLRLQRGREMRRRRRRRRPEQNTSRLLYTPRTELNRLELLIPSRGWTDGRTPGGGVVGRHAPTSDHTPGPTADAPTGPTGPPPPLLPRSSPAPPPLLPLLLTASRVLLPPSAPPSLPLLLPPSAPPSLCSTLPLLHPPSAPPSLSSSLPLLHPPSAPPSLSSSLPLLHLHSLSHCRGSEAGSAAVPDRCFSSISPSSIIHLIGARSDARYMTHPAAQAL
ncbi:unnamed protein product [Arctogadus glacialis]